VTIQRRELWQQLEAFAFDPPTARLTFAARLAKENGWTDDYARRVIEEYRRFLFLAQTAGHPVSPSEDVDQAWHLHLTYSKSYWEDLCGKVLGQPFHHMPAQGDDGEPARLREWYRNTLASYRRLFGEAPPRDIWPDVEERFAATTHVRVNRQRHWVLPKPRRAGIIGAICVTLVALLATGCGQNVFLAIGGPWDLSGPEFLLLYAGLSVFVLLVVLMARYLGRGPGPAQWSRSEMPDPYETGYLAGYQSRALEAGIASLLQEGHLRFNPSAPWQVLIDKPLPAEPHWFEREIYDYVQEYKVVNYASVRRSGRLRERAETLNDRLVEAGCLLPAARAFWLRAWTAGLFVLLLCFGLSKIHVGLARQRPVEFLVLACIVTGIAAAVCFFWPTRRTRRGRAVLADLRAQQAPWRTRRVTPDLRGSQVATAVALFGCTMLAGSALAYMPQRFLAGPSSSNGSGGGVGGCSGGGGGGGGGCGGGGGGGGGGCGGCGGGGG
jgi:uncharacterized protein (TIGR04222 family)